MRAFLIPTFAYIEANNGRPLLRDIGPLLAVERARGKTSRFWSGYKISFMVSDGRLIDQDQGKNTLRISPFGISHLANVQT